MFPVLDQAANKTKYSGRSRAKVIDNRDPLQKGRIRVDHPILGQTTWIPYLRLPHFFDVPSINDVVYVESDSGVYTHPIAWGNLTKGEDSNHEVPPQFKRDIPTNRGIFTPAGHFIEFDDGEATVSNAPVDTNLTTKNRGIRITSAANNKIHIVEDTVNSNQYILIQAANGSLIKLDYKNNELNIVSTGKINTTATTDQTENIGGKLSINVTGNCEITCADSKITASGKVDITASGNTTVEGAEIKLGTGASEAVIKGTAFKTYFDTHTHPTAVGPSGPPASPMPGSTLSTKVKTE